MARPVRTAASVRKPSADGYTYVGRTSDGVRIIEPKVPPTHFTSEEMRETIDRVLTRLGHPGRADRRPGR
jgi:hypothetical protein